MELSERKQKILKAIVDLYIRTAEPVGSKTIAHLLALGLRGQELGEMLRFLLDYVIEYPSNNRRELLLSLARGTED